MLSNKGSHCSEFVQWVHKEQGLLTKLEKVQAQQERPRAIPHQNHKLITFYKGAFILKLFKKKRKRNNRYIRKRK